MIDINTDNYLDLEYPEDPPPTWLSAMLAAFGSLVVLIVGLIIIWLVRGR